MANTVPSIQEVLGRQPYRFSSDPAKFLQETRANALLEPWLLVPQSNTNTFPTLAQIPQNLLTSIQGVSIAAAIKLLTESDVGNNGWFLDRLRLPGSTGNSAINTDTQKVIIALLHGIHAYFVGSKTKGVPSFTTPLPTRFHFVVSNATDGFLNQKNVEDFFTNLKRRFLNQAETDDELQIRGLINLLQGDPANLLNTKFMKNPSGANPVPTQETDVPDTETVKDFYIRTLPSIHTVLGI